MPKRRLEHDSPPLSKFSRGCIVLSDDRIKLSEAISHLDSNFGDLISRGEHSKILILDGTHGSKDGGDSLTERRFYEPSFMEETCEALGTRHHVHRRRFILPRYTKVRPYPEQCLREWKRRGEFHDGINTIQALRKNFIKIMCLWKLSILATSTEIQTPLSGSSRPVTPALSFSTGATLRKPKVDGFSKERVFLQRSSSTMRGFF